MRKNRTSNDKGNSEDKMPNFSDLFIQSKGQPIRYKDKMLTLSDKFQVKDGDVLIVSIEKTNSEFRQGFCIDIAGSCEMAGKLFKQGKGVRMFFWQETTPDKTKLKIFTNSDFVRIENIWEQTNHYLMKTPTGETIKKESKSIEFRYNGAAMIVEEIESGKRYRCNDGTPDEDFDDIIFPVQRLKN